MPVLRAPSVGERPLGVVYTPPEVTEPMVRLALAPLLDRPDDDVAASRVCDFSVGEGAFLLAAKAAIAERLRSGSLDDAEVDRLAAGCVAGVDVDAGALRVARRRLGCPPGALRVADALALDWPAAFPGVFARGGFDVVVGNPPYIRQEQLTDKDGLRGFASYDGVADLYVYFLELVHRLLRPGGRYCVIAPNKWLTAAYGRKLRGYLAARDSIDGVVDLGRMPLFADADAYPCIVWGTVDRERDRPTGTSRRVRIGRAIAGDVATALRDPPGGACSPTILGEGPWHLDGPRERSLIQRLERTWPALGDVISGRPARGVVTGCNRAFVIDRDTRRRLLDADPRSAELIRPFVKGRDIRRWLASPTERWILLVDRDVGRARPDLADYPAIAAHLAAFRTQLDPRPDHHAGPWAGRKRGNYRWFELQDPVGELAKSRAPRLLYQDIQTGPACALDRSGEVVPDTTVWMLPSDDRCLLAILNSSLYGWYARRRFPPALNGAVRPKLAYVRALPIAMPGPAARAEIEQLVDARLATGDPDRARTLDAALDRAVLDLYELSAAERRLCLGEW